MNLDKFLERNKNKSFVTNLMKYTELDYYGQCKVISSFLTHMFIDMENGIECSNEITEITSLLVEKVLYKQDNFMGWLSKNGGNN